MKVLCLWYATKGEVDYISKAMPPGTKVVAPEGEYFSRFESTYSDLENQAHDADVFIGWTLPQGILEIANKLELLCWLHAGCDDLNHSLLKQRGVKLANISGANAAAVAEQATMLLLALAKKALVNHRYVQEGRRPFPIWGDESRSAMLHGRTLGVIGVGSIGSRIAKHAKGFDMHVLGVRRNKERPSEYVDSMHGLDELHSVLAKSDYVVVAMPNTKETSSSFGKAELAAMKSSAFLVNISRAAVIQEKPLYEALTSGRLRGFAADVWWRYEFGRSFPIHWGSRLDIQALPNVICSNNHANSDDVLEACLQWGTQNLVEFAAGKPLTREVSLDLGY